MSRPSSTWRWILLVAVVSFILIATLRPFNFRVGKEFTTKRVSMIEWSPMPSLEHESEFIDASCNILFFFPYGVAFFVHQRKKTIAPLIVLMGTVSGTLLSALCETAQIWLPTRHPQVLDVAANTFGALCGATVAAAWDRIDTLTSPGELRNGIRWGTMSGSLLILLVLALLYPAFRLDPVRSVEELETHAKSFLHSTLFDRLSVENVFLPLLLLGALAFSIAEWAMKSFPSLRLPFTYAPVFLLSSAYAVLLPIPRIFSRSLSPNWGSILFGVLGVSIGIVLHRWLRLPAFRSLEDKEMASRHPGKKL